MAKFYGNILHEARCDVNLARIQKGCLKVLGRSQDWPQYFDLSRRGWRSLYFCLPVSMLFYFVCAAAAQTRRARHLEVRPDLPIVPFFLILLLYTLMFALVAYGITMIFDRQDRFRPWVIIRYWTMFFAALIAAIFSGFYLLGILGFIPAMYLVLLVYLGTLAIDIRLAQRIAEFDWAASVFIGCIITGCSLTMVLVGVLHYIG